MTYYQEATDKCVQGYGHSMMDSKCVGCGARNIFVVLVELDYEAAERVALRSLWTDKRSYVRGIVDAALGIGGSE